MYAIVDIAGQQLKVEKDQKIFVNRLEGKEGSTIEFDQVLLIEDKGKVQVGTPIVKDMIVSATIVSHLKGDKVKVFKKKRRKGYKVLNGHRQLLTELLVKNISAGKVKATAEKKKVESKPKAEKKVESLSDGMAKKPAEVKKTTTKTTTQKKEDKPKTAATKKPAKATTETKAKSTDTKKETKTTAKTKSATAKKPQASKTSKPESKKTASKK